MPRTAALTALLAAAGLTVAAASAGPLSNIRQTANDTRAASDDRQAEVQAAAEDAEAPAPNRDAAGHLQDDHDHAGRGHAGPDHGDPQDAQAPAANRDAAGHLRDGHDPGDHQYDHAGHDHGDHPHAHPHVKGDGHDHAEGHDELTYKEHKMIVEHAIAVMLPTEGSNTRGTIKFTQTKDGVTVTADISGLTPNAKHGFHIHEFGDISDPAGKAAGGHYNPDGHDHGLPPATYGAAGSEARHAGDLGNLQADDEGNATFSETFDNISLAGMTNPILGRGLIIHAQPDDGGQPTGNAGPRIAQGVVGVDAKD
jgi:Cu-Zn family superoxide dismutase